MVDSFRSVSQIVSLQTYCGSDTLLQLRGLRQTRALTWVVTFIVLIAEDTTLTVSAILFIVRNIGVAAFPL